MIWKLEGEVQQLVECVDHEFEEYHAPSKNLKEN
jgi:hypothetical protein